MSTCSRCCPTRAASRTSATSRSTPSATPSHTSNGEMASACCTRWVTTLSACRPRTTRSRPAKRRAYQPKLRSPSSRASSVAGESRSTGRASWPPASPTTTAGRSGSSTSCSRPGLPIGKRHTSTGARATKRCSRTSRSLMAAASAAALRLRSASSSNGS